MSVEFEAGRPGGLNALRTGAAMALVLAMGAAAMPAQAQSAPEEVSEAAEDDQTATTRAASGPEGERDRVYVLGRRVGSSLATVDADDVPQVVNIISQETLQEQGVASLEQALRNVPGITTQIGEGGVMSGDQFFIRGISAKNDIFTDGLRDFGVYTRDSFNYGQVEVFKGPSASAFGRGAAGGGINTSSKTPFADTTGSAAIAVGDADYLRITGDWNQNLGSGMAARVAVMSHEGGSTGRDQVYSERWGFAPSFAFGLDSPTTVTIAYLHQDEEKLTDYGIPTTTVNGVFGPVSDFGVDSSNFYGYSSDVDKTTVDTVTVRLRHEANDWLTLTSDTRWGSYQRFARFTPAGCNATCATALSDGDPATVPVATPGGPGPWDQDTQGVQNITAATITAPLFGMRSEFVGGFDVTWQNNDRNQYAYGATRPNLDLLNPAFNPGVPLAAGRSNIRDTTTRDVSVFANERLWINDQWSLTGGLRWGAYEVDQNTTTFTTTGSTFAGVGSNSDFVTPQVGVIWEPAANQQWYLSYSQSAKPQGASTNNGDTIANPTTPTGVSNKDLEPEENTNIELGGRIGLFEDRVQLQGAVFQTKKDNSKILDVNGDLLVGSGDAQEITGVELGLAGMITDEWSVNVNGTWLDTEITDSSTAANIGKSIQFTPETAASLWTTYNFTGGLAGLEVGGGLTYQGEVWLNAANTAAVDSYTTVDGFVSYGWDRFRISLNGYNLSDELYFAQIHGNRVTPGQGRTFIATLGVVY
ncbi:MAG: TonB-dependent siderophore receptor [Hyphomonadaceae bacterium]|nr:TonB-dependent siderophore receptor [Hyphomonadaceae bacterium]